MTSSQKAVIALLLTVVLWSLHVLIARIIVVGLSPLTVHFIRIFFASLVFIPIFIYSGCWKKEKFGKVLLISVLPSVNMVFFILGIKYTTGAASQLIYAAEPILIVFITSILLGKKVPFYKIIGVVIGLCGILYIIYLSSVESGETISGSLKGNFLIIIAMTGWVSYMLLSKKFSKFFSPTELGSTSIFIAFLISIPLLAWDLSTKSGFPLITQKQLIGTLYMGIFGTFITYILYQYAIKHLNLLTVSLSSYILPVTVAFLEILILNTKLTTNFLIGSLLVLSGIFLSTTFEVYKRRQ